MLCLTPKLLMIESLDKDWNFILRDSKMWDGIIYSRSCENSYGVSREMLILITSFLLYLSLIYTFIFYEFILFKKTKNNPIGFYSLWDFLIHINNLNSLRQTLNIHRHLLATQYLIRLLSNSLLHLKPL